MRERPCCQNTPARRACESQLQQVAVPTAPSGGGIGASQGAGSLVPPGQSDFFSGLNTTQMSRPGMQPTDRTIRAVSHPGLLRDFASSFTQIASTNAAKTIRMESTIRISFIPRIIPLRNERRERKGAANRGTVNCEYFATLNDQARRWRRSELEPSQEPASQPPPLGRDVSRLTIEVPSGSPPQLFPDQFHISSIRSSRAGSNSASGIRPCER